MVQSRYILDILELLLERDEEGISAKKQLPFITEESYEYTVSGLFVSFKNSDEILKFKASKDNLILDGVKIEAVDYSIEAHAILFFKNSIIDYLEIWCYLGEYPKKELTKYKLSLC